MNATDVENVYLANFQKQGYGLAPGGSLLDASISMSYVMSAGWAQVEQTWQQAGVQRPNLVFVQNCFRHFDLVRVGEDDLHLSFFRMAGAFAFGAISQQSEFTGLWRLLTEDYRLPAERLWATYFCGDRVLGQNVAADDETRSAWLAAGLLEERLVGKQAGENFWKQSQLMIKNDHLPKCGPNSEVFFDLGSDRRCGPGCGPGCGCGRFVEFMNILLINAQEDLDGGRILALERPFMEVVIGVERLACLTQARQSVFEIDTIAPILELARRFAQPRCLSTHEIQRQERRLADHLRAIFYLAADGAPEPYKRGARAFIMRRLTRRLFANLALLGIPLGAFLPAALDIMPAVYLRDPETFGLAREVALKYLAMSQAQYERAEARAQRMLERLLAHYQIGDSFPGEQVLLLEKQAGIPMELIESWLRDRGLVFDCQDYQKARLSWQRQHMATAPAPANEKSG